MIRMNMRKIVILVIAVAIGCVIGARPTQGGASKRENRGVGNHVKREPNQRPDREIQPISSRSVIINKRRLSDQEIDALTRVSTMQVKDGNYWYDPMSGAWGQQGGPAAGFIAAGLNLGGPLHSDASHGDTGVFINGRQLHRIDVARLMQIGPVYQSRCWMDAQGNIGLEGQPAFGNVWAAATQAPGGGGKREGILSTYDKTGVAVFGY